MTLGGVVDWDPTCSVRASCDLEPVCAFPSYSRVEVFVLNVYFLLVAEGEETRKSKNIILVESIGFY